MSDNRARYCTCCKAWHNEDEPCLPTSRPETVRQLCHTHPNVNYKTEWGCPDCVRELRAERDALREALQAAQQHLEYCGYGDKWERECAVESNLEERINSALANQGTKA